VDLEKFREDVYEIAENLSKTFNENNTTKLNFVRQKLIDMYQQNLVKINHSVLELICAANLISRDYTVDVEKPISDILVCDVYAEKGNEAIIIEIETGFTPPDHALDTINYYSARIMSKISRYSKYCSKFSLASPVIGILPIPKLFLTPPNARKKDDAKKLKSLCDRFYRNPPIELDDILNARLHSIYLINTDKRFAKEIDPKSYLELTKDLIQKSEITF